MAPIGSHGLTPRDPELDAEIVFSSDWVYAWALRKNQHETDAAEMRQTAAVRLTVSPRTARKTTTEWLERLAVQCLLAVQQQRIDALHLEEGDLEAATPSDPELRDRLARAISRLSVQERYVFEQCRLGSVSPAIVAESLGHSVNYVHLHESRARARMRRYLEQEQEKNGENS